MQNLQGQPRFGVYFWIALAAAVGGGLRHVLSVAWIVHWGDGWPWPTLLVNVVGSFLIVAFWTLSGPDGRFPVSVGRQAAFMAGFCGGFTTFSLFGVETWQLVVQGRIGDALGYVGLTLVGALLAAALGACRMMPARSCQR
ncbi:MAG: CrcB family protein [Xanthomonadaceae bacterium]|nr:CrcB family protein [Xanthomonadaceae bacterium]